MSETDKTHLGIVIVGHVDAGKSTTAGRLLFELGDLSKRELEKLRQEAHALGKDSFVYAFFFDKSKQERRRGLTIQCCTKEFFTESYHYTLVDAPGHRDFIKNMISGTAQADVALLMVPANRGGFESSIAKSNHKKHVIEGQTRQHARLCHLLGIEQLIVGVNKMDEKSVNYSQARFEEIRYEVGQMLTKIGFKTKKIPFIPMSGYRGDNLLAKSPNMPWWNGFEVKSHHKVLSGVTLYDALDKVMKPPKRITNKPFRMPVSGIYKITGIGDVITGRIEQGLIQPHVNVKFYPRCIKNECGGKVFSIEMHHKHIESAECGDNIGVNVRGLNKNNMPHVGDIMVIDDKAVDPNPPCPVASFEALVFVQDHPGKLYHAKLQQHQQKQAAVAKKGKESKPEKPAVEMDYKGGFTPSVHVRTAKAPCQMIAIKWKMGKSTSNVKVENPPFIEAGDQAQVVFHPKVPLVVTTFDECKAFGRIAAMDSNSLVMLGKVIGTSTTQ
eukprot:CAMPEP_0197074228 /NCGR_PEP_ID=MMETSP1384-20130603/211002_1 /TAXON_ID=29189 /ORGANISM="Ammonia sp." /LENGTH=497 /DNA_ID=CAMNT_0042513069 /DNA_START=49 /DNA_END=1542 /DNA_ORIENTATION=+